MVDQVPLIGGIRVPFEQKKMDVGFAERRIVNNRTLPPLSANRGSVSAGVNDDDGWLADDYGDDDDDAVRRLGSGFA